MTTLHLVLEFQLGCAGLSRLLHIGSDEREGAEKHLCGTPDGVLDALGP